MRRQSLNPVDYLSYKAQSWALVILVTAFFVTLAGGLTISAAKFGASYARRRM